MIEVYNVALGETHRQCDQMSLYEETIGCIVGSHLVRWCIAVVSGTYGRCSLAEIHCRVNVSLPHHHLLTYNGYLSFHLSS